VYNAIYNPLVPVVAMDLSAKSQDPGMGTPVTANLFVPDDRDNMK
jgi:hypothetical protein